MSEGRAYGGESAEARAARRRAQLLAAGLAVFGTIGFRKATVRQLCREARVADRYFYDEFSSTEDLLLAVYDECHHVLRSAVTSAIADLHAEAGIDDVITVGLDAYLACVQDNPPLARLLWYEVLGVSEQVERRHVQRLNEFGELLGLILESRGLRLVEQTVAGRSILLTAIAGGVSQVTMNWIDNGYSARRADLVAPLASFIRSAAEMARVR
ncbi:TetR/AcrR family transcriptional regulator [Rhodococcus artemisiae]|uniref:TetR/AcrR family transcriptional regulator n=1 Tax=Rhodococcus artemisiae TaxID=714159 RepID=A0ABU7LAF0_9NOCA|nr:TetR/AcrR family transcriptional regulator [Rhodococcus artemisiae]MEE2058523.1 TetR/AcrR family transcriptional regulator [Rhodococcus artemisiae]